MKTVLIIIYVIVALVLTVLTLMQSKDDDGMSAAITGGSFYEKSIMGSSGNNFYEKNKGRTKEGKLRRNTIILGVAFIVLAIVLGIFY